MTDTVVSTNAQQSTIATYDENKEAAIVAAAQSYAVSNRRCDRDAAVSGIAAKRIRDQVGRKGKILG